MSEGTELIKGLKFYLEEMADFKSLEQTMPPEVDYSPPEGLEEVLEETDKNGE